jgi:alcohol dehydrogenase class IV
LIRFDARTQIIISNDLSFDVNSVLEEGNFKKILLFVDSKVADQNDVKKLIGFIKRKFILDIEKIDAVEPTTSMVNFYKSKLKSRSIDMIIGIGGGSVIDLSKAISVMLVNKGKVEDYHGTGKQIKTAIKKIMIPTTAGTGSEVTPGAVLVNRDTSFKRAISGRCISPDYAILYAKLTTTLPDEITASTGMDALAHSIESYTARNASEVTKMYSKKAFSLIFNNLPKIFKDRKNVSLREKVLLGSCLAGYAIYNSNTGACHSMAYPLGIYNNVPHSIAVGIILPKVIRMNFEKGCDIYADLYELIDNLEKIPDKNARAKEFCSILDNYRPMAFIKDSFGNYGIDESNYKFLAERGLDLTSALNNNPTEFGLSNAIKVLKMLI